MTALRKSEIINHKSTYSMQVQSDTYIHAATGAAWQKFSQLHNWPKWSKSILDTQWLEGKPWEEGSRFQLYHHSLLGRSTTNAQIRMSIPGNTVVWESRQPGILVVNSVRFSDTAGGCTFWARHAYHGPLAILFQFLRVRQQRNLEGAVGEFKSYVEGLPR